MKHLIVVTAVALLFFSCKKEQVLKSDDVLSSAKQFLNTIQTQLKDSLSSSEYATVNFSQVYKSKDVQSRNYFVRIGRINRDFATDFILLQADSRGHILGGKLIHVDGANAITPKHKKFNGTVTISSLDKRDQHTVEVVDGRWKTNQAATAVSKPVDDNDQQPAGEQILPEVVVISYTSEGTETEWYWYGGLYSGGAGGYSETGYTYGAATGGGGSSNTVNDDNTIVIQMEPNDNVPIKVEDYLKCFSSVPDANATYQIAIYSDIPVNGDPNQIFNWSTGSPGHSFIQLTKTSGTASVQQNFGFYPSVGWKTLGPYPTESKIVDNGGHEFDASLTQRLSSIQFNVTIEKIEAIENKDYDLDNWNCTDFALSVYNAAANNQLSIPQYITEGNGEMMNTPQGLYVEIQSLQKSNNTFYGTPNVPTQAGHAGASHGSCGQ